MGLEDTESGKNENRESKLEKENSRNEPKTQVKKPYLGHPERKNWELSRALSN